MEAPQFFIQIILQIYSLSLLGNRFEPEWTPYLLKEEELSLGFLH